MMMKSSGVITFVAALLILASCSSVNDNLEKMIPADALGVVSINMPEILNKTGINDNGKLVVPQEVQDIIDQNDAQTICTVVTDLPYLGIDTDSKAFAFFTNKTFGTVVLMALSDEQAARKTIERRTGADFSKVEGIDCIYREDNIYVINDKVLLIGTVN